MRVTDIRNEEMPRSFKLCTRKTNNLSTSTKIMINIGKDIMFVMK